MISSAQTNSKPRRRKTTDVTTVAARNNFSDVINRAAYGKERVVLTRRGKPVAVIIPPEDLEELNNIVDPAKHKIDI